MRLLRDGWRVIQEPVVHEHPFGAKLWIEYDPPMVWAKAVPRHPELQLRMLLCGIHEKDGPWYVKEHTIARSDGRVVTLGVSDWADFDHGGRVVFARDGRLWALSGAALSNLEVDRAVELVDLRDREFEARPSPPHASSWF
jgi:hypothetical protein